MKRAAKLIKAPAPVLATSGLSPLLRWTLAASVGMHLIVLSLHFELPRLFKTPAQSPPLEVSLVNAKTTSKPSQADFLAQANLDGGGNTDAKRRLSSPLPRAQVDSQQTQLAAAREQVEALERQTRELLQQLKSANRMSSERDPKETPKVDSANTYRELAAKTLELQRLEAQIAREFDSYQQRPKKKHVGARAAEYRFARYVEDWRQKVERVGNANYPEIARTQKLYGSLVLTVGIKADGRIESVEVDRGSGKKILDAAALKIVELAAPYAPFPADIRADTDILYITRTWSFTRAGELESSAGTLPPSSGKAP
ncbi:MAG: energy transducer TonB [Burkholderiales bacterium]|nr:energy transducer TonB [Burkholderiales bacterium]MCZ2134566.1 TonB family protein [Burkholderiales bacterium]